LGAFSYISISINFFRHILHQTSGKLYIVNKISRNIEVFDLLTGKEVAEIPIDLESHEAVALSGQNKVVVTNYGTVDRGKPHQGYQYTN
jgi:hypothetical protein